jgi:YhcH/YjgK/YiaL family protein
VVSKGSEYRMILDTLQSMNKYCFGHPAFSKAFDFLRSTDIPGFTSGKMEIEGDRLFAIASVATGVGVSGARLEAHRRYIDIQYAVSGIDNIGWKPISRCVGVDGSYDADKDIIFYSDVPETWFGLTPGSCAVFFPEDAHAPLAVNGTLHKIVVKVLVNW